MSNKQPTVIAYILSPTLTITVADARRWLINANPHADSDLITGATLQQLNDCVAALVASKHDPDRVGGSAVVTHSVDETHQGAENT